MTEKINETSERKLYFTLLYFENKKEEKIIRKVFINNEIWKNYSGKREVEQKMFQDGRGSPPDGKIDIFVEQEITYRKESLIVDKIKTKNKPISQSAQRIFDLYLKEILNSYNEN